MLKPSIDKKSVKCLRKDFISCGMLKFRYMILMLIKCREIYYQADPYRRSTVFYDKCLGGCACLDI